MNTLDTFLCALCAASFASTLILLLVSYLQQLTSPTKVRLLQLAFSLTLSAVVVFTLART